MVMNTNVRFSGAQVASLETIRHVQTSLSDFDFDKEMKLLDVAVADGVFS